MWLLIDFLWPILGLPIPHSPFPAPDHGLSGLPPAPYIGGFGGFAGIEFLGLWKWKQMDDKQAKNSWDDLLQDLGAKPDESAFERHQAADQDIQPTVEWSEAEESADETEASPGDWNSLAESLGLEVEEPPKPVEDPVVAKDEPPAIAETKKAEVKEPVAERIVEEVVKKSDEPFGGFSAPGESAFVEDEEDDADADDYDADDYDTAEYDTDDEEASTSDEELPPLPSQMDQALSETAWDDDSEEEKGDAGTEDGVDDADGEGISGEAARSAFDALFSDGASGWGSAFLQKPKKEDSMRAAKSESADDAIDAGLSESLEAKTDGDGDGDEETERPKRKRSRRRRRGGRGRKSAGERVGAEGETSNEQSSADEDGRSDDQSDKLSEEVSSDEAGEEKAKRPRRRRSGQRKRPVEASSESDLDDDDLVGDEADDADSDDSQPRGAGRGRQLHRNLPTWSEAIGMIVDANLEQRAKSPSKPQASRGGRGGRGGRGRRRKSPESK